MIVGGRYRPTMKPLPQFTPIKPAPSAELDQYGAQEQQYLAGLGQLNTRPVGPVLPSVPGVESRVTLPVTQPQPTPQAPSLGSYTPFRPGIPYQFGGLNGRMPQGLLQFPWQSMGRNIPQQRGLLSYGI